MPNVGMAVSMAVAMAVGINKAIVMAICMAVRPLWKIGQQSHLPRPGG